MHPVSTRRNEAKLLERILTTHVHHSLVYKLTLLSDSPNPRLKSEEKHNSIDIKVLRILSAIIRVGDNDDR